jgi:pimeloyl-ACP methyl ester carboxylesterase
MACFVLVHGAFEGGWCFRDVARLLRVGGHDVHTPTLTGSGERFHLLTRDVTFDVHVQDVLGVLEHEGLSDVILVGHSYGGAVITQVADRVPERLRRVIYLDAVAPRSGESASGQDATADTLRAMAASESWLLPPLPAEAIGLTAARDVAWASPRRHPHPARTLYEPLQLQEGAAARGLPRVYLACARHEGLVALFGVDPLQPALERARSEGWVIEELEAPHDAMITHPDVVASLLLSHAE